MRKKKILLNKEQVLQLLKEMKNSSSILEDVKIALVGSFVKGTSDIDILISYDNKDNCDIEIFEYILNYMANKCDYKIDILNLESIIKADEELKNFAISEGLTVIKENTHEILLKEAICIG